MRIARNKWVLSFCLAVFIQFLAQAQNFTFSSALPVTIVYDGTGARLDSIAANLLAHDIELVTKSRPKVQSSLEKVSGNVIIIGNISSSLIQKFIPQQSALTKKIFEYWECYALKIIERPAAQISKALIIAGSDTRGTAYGVFALSEKIGVSPWYWWADVPVKQQSNLTLHLPEFVSAPPSVKYRGIFINDEDWGLQPWAAKTFEKETGDIGPKTYAKVFELLLRLKANLIWPAMHPSTKAFYYYPLNKQIAEDYSIVIGSSHAEPMLRNNVSEWNEKTMGAFNYLSNQQKVYEYWEDRVKETKSNEVVYTMGMRGVHDSRMEGVKDDKEAVPVLERIMKDQRDLLEKYLQRPIESIPLVFTAYKEVLDIYDNGLKLPDDIAIVWPDDNYGYIQRLDNKSERSRHGGSGIYYHASYWGRPHDYLWLSSTHPGLIREEMMKALQNGSDEIWVLNVGDIKPLEYNIQLFMDMAYKKQSFKSGSSSRKHLNEWVTKIFGQQHSNEISSILWQYYQLAFERRPEFMGWSQTEPTTKTQYTAYNHFQYGDEAQKRIEQYELLTNKVKALRKEYSTTASDAFYQLVYYPVVCASWMNKKFLYRDKAFLYAIQNRLSANNYSTQSMAAYDSIVNETNYYNEQLSNGKWKGIMSMKPRELPVYLAPVLPAISIQKGGGWDIVPEGYDTLAYQQRVEKKLPAFLAGINHRYFIDIFLNDSIQVEWKATASADWIKLSTSKGVLNPEGTKSSMRVWVSVERSKLQANKNQRGRIDFEVNGRIVSIPVEVLVPVSGQYSNFRGFVEMNGVVSIYANHYQQKVDGANNKWELLNGLGRTDTVVQSVISKNVLEFRPDTVNIRQSSACLSYRFFSFSNKPSSLAIYTLPTHPLNKDFSMRYAVGIDDLPLRIVDFKTVGRSEEWKQNVLRNEAIREISIPALKPGVHTIKIYAIDPGVLLDRMVIEFANATTNYGIIPENRK